MSRQTPLVTISNASKHFGGVAGFQSVSLSLQNGSVLAVAGPNGGGKTTLLRCMAGLYNCDEAGSISYGFQSSSKFELRRQIAYAPDDDNLIEELSGHEYLEFVSQLYGIEKSVARTKAKVLLENLQFRYSALTSLVRSYSHGMRKKLQLASVLMIERPLTLIDEPTNGLDPSTVILTKQIIKRAADHGGIVVSSHNLAFAQAVADQVLLLSTHPVAAGSLGAILEGNSASNLEEAYENIMMTNNVAGGADGHR